MDNSPTHARRWEVISFDVARQQALRGRVNAKITRHINLIGWRATNTNNLQPAFGAVLSSGPISFLLDRRECVCQAMRFHVSAMVAKNHFRDDYRDGAKLTAGNGRSSRMYRKLVTPQ